MWFNEDVTCDNSDEEECKIEKKGAVSPFLFAIVVLLTIFVIGYVVFICMQTNTFNRIRIQMLRSYGLLPVSQTNNEQDISMVVSDIEQRIRG